VAKVKFDPKTARKTFIREWRKYRNLTLEQVAEVMRVTPGALSQLENHTGAYTQPMLEGLAQIFQCEPSDLITRPPSDDETITSIWSAVPIEDRKRALKVLQAFSTKN